MDAPLLTVHGLGVRFPRTRGLFGRAQWFHAVENISFELRRGRALGLVGESGSGKSTVARAVLRLIDPFAGSVHLDGQDVLGASARKLRVLRRRMQIIFQDPAGSLNPRMRIADIVGEPLVVHGLEPRGTARLQRVIALLEQCGLPAEAADRFPHQFSGGQRQRIAIARALALKPDLLVCDEPTSALDVSVQAQIINLLADLRDKLGLAYLFISHDMAVVSHLCDDIAVMRGGRIVEAGSRDDVLGNPREEYTRELLRAVPKVAV